MGIRKLIYISSQELWNEIAFQAKLENRSVSNYLMNLHTMNVTDGFIVPVEDEPVTVRAERKVKKPHEKKKDDSFRPLSKSKQLGKK